MENRDALKECPFCGSCDVELSEVTNNMWQVACDNCPAQTAFLCGRNDTLRLYNTRAEHKQEVDLEKCARAVFKVACNSSFIESTTYYRDIAKACLAAAGIEVK